MNDAKAIAVVLKKLGFEVLFYFDGHGLQINGENYLIPIKSGIEFEEHVRYRAVNVGEVLAEMEFAGNGRNIVILDACRNNSLRRSFRSYGVGLVGINAPAGTLIAYATEPGSISMDGEGRNQCCCFKEFRD